MLSILIPTYNYKVISLVKSLHKQLNNQNNPYEILCFDNGSDTESHLINEKINKLENCTYTPLKKMEEEARPEIYLHKKPNMIGFFF